MTVETENITSGPYVYNGSTTVYPYSFRLLNPSDLVVKIVSVAPDLFLTYLTHYTVQETDEVSGTFTLTAAGVAYVIANPGSIWAVRETQIIQSTDLQNQGAYFPEVVEDAFDRLTLYAQEAKHGVEALENYIADNGGEIPSGGPTAHNHVWADITNANSSVLALLAGSAITPVTRVTTAVLRAMSSTGLLTGAVMLVEANDSGRAALYVWTPSATRLDDGRSTIKPTDIAEAGRWMRFGMRPRIHYVIGQSNADRVADSVVTVPTGTWPAGTVPIAGTYTKVAGSPDDTFTFTGPATVSAGVRVYDNSGAIVSVASAPAVLTGRNNTGLGAAVRLHQEHDDPVTLVKIAQGSTPLDYWLKSNVVNITSVSVAGSVVTVGLSDIRGIQIETLPNPQYVDLVSVGGIPALNGRFRVNDRSPAWGTTRNSASPVAGTVKLYNNDGTAYNGTGLPAYTGGGKMQLHWLWNDFENAIAGVVALEPNALVTIQMSQSEGNEGALPTDLFTTVGGKTSNFDKSRAEFVTQVRAHPNLGYAPLAFEEAARDGVNFPIKFPNVYTSATSDIDPMVGVYSSAGRITEDQTHFADQYGGGYRGAGTVLLGLERSGNTEISDPAWLTLSRAVDGSLGHRWSSATELATEVWTAPTDRMLNRRYMNGHYFRTICSRIELNVDELATAARGPGGHFMVYAFSNTGNTPNGVGGTDATAAGRTSVVASGVTFIDARTAVETTGIYYIPTTKQPVDFRVIAPTTIAVISHR